MDGIRDTAVMQLRNPPTSTFTSLTSYIRFIVLFASSSHSLLPGQNEVLCSRSRCHCPSGLGSLLLRHQHCRRHRPACLQVRSPVDSPDQVQPNQVLFEPCGGSP